MIHLPAVGTFTFRDSCSQNDLIGEQWSCQAGLVTSRLKHGRHHPVLLALILCTALHAKLNFEHQSPVQSAGHSIPPLAG